MMNIDDLRELAANRRSIRGYDKTKNVPDEMVRRILDCARWAPSTLREQSDSCPAAA